MPIIVLSAVAGVPPRHLWLGLETGQNRGSQNQQCYEQTKIHFVPVHMSGPYLDSMIHQQPHHVSTNPTEMISFDYDLL